MTKKKDENIEIQTNESVDAVQESAAAAQDVTADLEKWKELAMRSQADMENLRKRTQIDLEKTRKYANAGFAKELLSVADYLDGAIVHAQKEINHVKEIGEKPNPFLENLLTGVEMTQKQLMTVFKQNHIEKMPAVGVVFDPNFHKVIQEIEDGSKEPGTIVQELQPGYTIHGDRVLREAMVIVSK